MGDRAQVRILGSYREEGDTGVYLYTHWNSYKLCKNVKIALQRRNRWDDETYLARMIFEQMLTDATDPDTGFGIGTEEVGDINLLVTVDCKDKTVAICPEGLIPNKMTFEQFIEEDLI